MGVWKSVAKNATRLWTVPKQCVATPTNIMCVNRDGGILKRIQRQPFSLFTRIQEIENICAKCAAKRTRSPVIYGNIYDSIKVSVVVVNYVVPERCE